MKPTTARRFGSLGRSFVAPAAAAAVMGAALIASDTSDTAQTVWSPAAACLLPDVLPVAGTLLSYGGNRQLAAGGTVTHAGGLTVGGAVSPDASATRNLGSTSAYWNTAHVTTLRSAGAITVNTAGTGYGLFNFGSNGFIDADQFHFRSANSATTRMFIGATGLTLPVTRQVTFTDSAGSPMSLQAIGVGAIRFTSQFSGFGELRPGGNGSPSYIGSPSLNIATVSTSGFIGFGFGADAGYSGGYFTLRPSGGTARFRNADDSADAPITCGAIAASGQVTSSLFRALIADVNFRVGTGGSVRFINQDGALAAFVDPFSGKGVFQRIAICSSAFVEDVLLVRNATGPTLSVQSAGGLAVRNLAGTADAPITCAAITASRLNVVTDNIFFGEQASQGIISIFGNQYRFGDSVAGFMTMGKSISCGLVDAGPVVETPTQSALNPTTINIATGRRRGWYNTALGEFRDWVNIGGTLFKSAAFT